MVDYIEFSQKIKAQYPQYANVDDRVLAEKMIAKYPQYGEKVTFDTKEEQPTQKKGIDLTPSNIMRNIAAAPTAAIRSIVTKEPFLEAQQKVMADAEKWRGGIGKVNDFITDMATYSALPQARLAKGAGIGAKIVNNVLTGAGQGAVIGSLESLKDKGDLSGIGSGALTGGTITAGLPLAGNVIKQTAKIVPATGGLVSRTIGRVKPETLAQAIKPNSQALDLTEETAQNLLMDTTERIQKDYQNLMNNAGQKVQEASLHLPEDRGVWASSLKNSLDDIYNSYSTSGIKELNPAHNNAGDIYDSIMQQIDAGSNVADIGKVSAKNLNDIMGNIKNYNINWDNSNAKNRQQILKQIYGDFSRRLGNLSPELRKANKAYSQLAQFEDNEGVRRILQPAHKGDLDVPASALRNYNSTVTKGNTNRNIQDLERILVENGKQPFLNDIDDVNAAMDLLNIRGTGDSWLANFATQATRPALKGVRAYNRFAAKHGLQALYDALGRETPRYLTPLLYGGVSSFGD